MIVVWILLAVIHGGLMKYYVLLLIFTAAAGLSCHIIHELLHIIVGKICGLRLVSVEWFRAHGGTKVTFENEQEVTGESDSNVSKAWLYMNLAGITGTTLLAYIFVIVFRILPPGYPKLFFMVISRLFLIVDPAYAVLCAFGSVGDLYLVNRALGKKAYLTRVISVSVMIINIALFIFAVRQ